MKKALALLLSLVMVFQMLPVSVLAEGEGYTQTEGTYSGVESYTVSYTVDGTTTDKTAQKGTKLSEILPASPSREDGEPFVGWVDNEGRSVDPSSTTVSAEINVIAVFGATTAKQGSDVTDETYYTVTFVADGENLESRQIKEGENIGEFPAAPVREGYTFHHWVISGKSGDVNAATTVTEDMVIAASYTCDYPAINLQGYGNGWTISVKVPEGALPETTLFRVRKVNGEDYRSSIEEAMGGAVNNITAVDLFFVNLFDRTKEIEPLKPVTVNVSISGLDNTASHSVVHIKDGGEAEVVQNGVEGSKFTFEADQFSIYAVVDDVKIVTANFYDEDGELVNTQYIRKVDNAIQPLYNPQWDLEYGTEFYGWATETGASSGKTIDSINEDIARNWDSYSADTTLSYYADVQKVYVVTFNRYNDAGDLVTLKTSKVPPAQNTITIPGDLSGANLGDQFLGWISQDGALHETGTTYTVTGHTEFFLKETGRFWLVFDANAGGPGSGADYTPPQLIFGDGVVTKKPEDPNRTGYTFLGWNTAPDGTGTWWYKTQSTENEFGGKINADVTLYAQWEGTQTNYYVIYWQQSASDEAGLDNAEKTYVYAGSERRSAKTGDPVSTKPEDTTKGGTTNSEYGYFFTYNADNSDKTATVAANGTTVLNVRYDRREITYNFIYSEPKQSAVMN